MRLLALLGVLSLSTQFAVCERRNYSVCSSDPGYGCEDGNTCVFGDGGTVGTCVAASCGPNLPACPSGQPLCLSGRCTACSSGAQCQAVNGGLTPQCASNGSCVGCRGASDCTDPSQAICDSSSHACRPCTAHSDCPLSGVCAKDDSFAGLSKPIAKGTCVDKSRVVVVDQSTCPTGCTLSSKLALVSADQPYLSVQAHTSTAKLTLGPKLPAGLPTYYIIGPTADFAPTSRLTQPLAFSMTNGAGVALSVSPGVHTIIEGLVVVGATQGGLECAAAGTTTRVKVLRSFFAGNKKAITSSAQCLLTVDSSWIGKGPRASSSLGVYQSGNDVAMELDSTSLLLVNSVVWHNGTFGAFGGIQLSDSATARLPVRIVNSTFANQPLFDPTRKTLAIDCVSSTAPLSLVNSLFANTSPVGATYLHPSCQATFASLASNDPSLACPSCATDISDTILISGTPIPATENGNGDLHFLSSVAPASVTTGGVTSFSDGAGSLPIPTSDIEGLPRGKSHVSIGACEAP